MPGTGCVCAGGSEPRKVWGSPRMAFGTMSPGETERGTCEAHPARQPHSQLCFGVGFSGCCLQAEPGWGRKWVTAEKAAFAGFAGTVSQSIAQDVSRVTVMRTQPRAEGAALPAASHGCPGRHVASGPASRSSKPACFRPKSCSVLPPVPPELVALLSPLSVVWVKFGVLLGRGLGPAPG